MPRKRPRDKFGTSEGTPGTFRPIYVEIQVQGAEFPRERRDIWWDRWDMSMRQTGHTHRAKILYVYCFFIPRNPNHFGEFQKIRPESSLRGSRAPSTPDFRNTMLILGRKYFRITHKTWLCKSLLCWCCLERLAKMISETLKIAFENSQSQLGEGIYW